MSVSFDTFANITVMGYSFRLCQMAALLLFVTTFAGKCVVFPRKSKLLIWFAIVNTLFIGNSILYKNGIGYGLWLWFDVFMVIALYSYCADNYEACQWIINIFLKSFYYIALLALIQFVLGLLHFDFYIQQWWLSGTIPRVSGFSYEPSYYSTYMIVGWTIYAYLLEDSNELLKQRIIKIRFCVITLAMLLSTSRMGWLMMALWIVRLILFALYDVSRKKTTIQRLQMYTMIAILIVGISCGLLFINNHFFNVKLLLNGLEANGSSSKARINMMFFLLGKWIEAPFKGISLGGISPLLALEKNISLNEVVNVNKGVMPANITAELLVATGIIGCSLFYYNLLHSAKVAFDTKDSLCRAIAYGLGMIILILQFNQNILRPYLWVDIAMLYISIEYSRLKGIKGQSKKNEKI